MSWTLIRARVRGTNLRGQTEPKRRFSLIFADSRLFLLENEASGKRRFSQKTADFRRKPQKTAGTRRKPQIGVCPLGFVPSSAALTEGDFRDRDWEFPPQARNSEECQKPQPPLLLKESIAVHLQFVLQYALNLYYSAFGVTEYSGKGNASVLLLFVSQYASHL